MRISKFLCTFVADMRKLTFLILLFVSLSCAHAETILLRTGVRVKGTVVFQNEEVVIIRNEEGARFQYPRADVEAVLTDEEASAKDDEAALNEDKEEIKTPKKASILLELAGGAAVNPNEAVGGAVSVDLLVGSHHIGDRHLFVGGGLGYHGLFLGEDKYNFLPIQAAVRMPFTESKHAPVFGVAAGYGVALSKEYLGGLYASADFGYRCQLNSKTAVALVFYTQFQQAFVSTTTDIEGETFTTKAGRNFVSAGLKLALYF